MSAPLWKATAPSGRDFRTGTIDYATQVDGGLVTHPNSEKIVPNEPTTYLSVSTEPAETLIGGSWPCRLFRVEAVGDVVAGLDISPHKRAVLALRVIEEVEGWRALGPHGREVAAIIARAALLAPDEVSRLDAAWSTASFAARDATGGAASFAARGAARATAGIVAWDTARGAARDAAGIVAWDTAGVAAGPAAGDAAWGAVVRDLITSEQYATLAGPWESVIGPMLSIPTVEGER